MTDWSGAGDPRFFTRAAPVPLAELARIAGGSVAAEAGERAVSGVAPLQTATPEQLSFLDNRRYAPLLAETRAGAVIVHPELAPKVPDGTVAIVTATPYLGWARAAARLHPVPPGQPGVHSSAVVAGSARVDPTAEVGPFAVVGEAAEIGAGCRIGPHAVVGDGVRLGEHCRVGAHASVSHALLGARVTIYPGARIGQEGFGFARSDEGFVTVPQLGRVLLGDDVEVGANTTIDRGSVQDTVIGAGTRLDNQVQIGHNVRVGRCCVIVSQVGISGSTVLDDFVVVAGQAGLIGHLHIGRGAKIGAQAGVMSDIPAGEEWLGAPAGPARAFLRQVATLRRMAAAERVRKGEANGRGDG